jgi:hypothetical protein
MGSSGCRGLPGLKRKLYSGVTEQKTEFLFTTASTYSAWCSAAISGWNTW